MHYVMSDIHGRYDRWSNMLNKIQFNKQQDRLFLLGDVIDRGPDGIRILNDIKNEQNVTLLRGNHEQLMLDALGWEKFLKNEIHQISQLMYSRNPRAMKLWMYNGGADTYNNFLCLSGQMQIQVLNYLQQAPLSVPALQVGATTYYLVHAYPAITQDITMFDMIWKRIHPGQIFFSDKTVIFGHTCTKKYQADVPYRIWHGNGLIGVDCGSARTDKAGRLACLRLEDLQEFYA